eukprot:SAG31_NODE_26938_length_434_cov_0.570149_2_plen_46_part_01
MFVYDSKMVAMTGVCAPDERANTHPVPLCHCLLVPLFTCIHARVHV